MHYLVLIASQLNKKRQFDGNWICSRLTTTEIIIVTEMGNIPSHSTSNLTKKNTQKTELPGLPAELHVWSAKN